MKNRIEVSLQEKEYMSVLQNDNRGKRKTFKDKGKGKTRKQRNQREVLKFT